MNWLWCQRQSRSHWYFRFIRPITNLAIQPNVGFLDRAKVGVGNVDYMVDVDYMDDVHECHLPEPKASALRLFATHNAQAYGTMHQRPRGDAAQTNPRQRKGGNPTRMQA